MSTALDEAQAKMDAMQVSLKSLLDEGKGAGTEFRYDNIKTVTDGPAEMKKRASALEEAGKQRDALKVVDDAEAALKRLGTVDPRERPPLGDPNTPVRAFKTLGEEVADWEYFKKFDKNVHTPDLILAMSLKALFSKPADVATATSGYGPDSPRTPLVVDFAYRPIQLLDRIRQLPITLETWKYMEWTTRTEGHGTAAKYDVAEAAVYTDVGFAAQEKTVDVIKKGVFIEATEEQFADQIGVQDYIGTAMPFILSQAIDYDLINRASVAGKPVGLLNKTGIGTWAKAADEPVLNALLQGIREVRVTGRARPDMILMHPTDYYREMGRTDLIGRYIISNPLTAMTEFRPWGVLAMECEALPPGTAVVGDFGMYAMIRDRQDVRTRFAPSFSTDNTGLSTGDAGYNTMRPTGKVMIYSDVRLAWGWLRAKAFCTVTGLE